MMMGEAVGLIKVVVLRGKRLVIRDFKSSDPYVILKLGNQVNLGNFSQIMTCSAVQGITAKTKVIKSCLNPVWNEEFSFTLSEPIGVVELEVFDRDRFKADDKMGHAQLSLQPLIAAARLKQILRDASDGMTLRKVIPETDNCLAAESSIIWANHEVVQDVWLRLCEVESGEIEVKIKLVNLPPVAPAKLLV